MMRWSKEDTANSPITPAAIKCARELERRGYAQAKPDDLDDQEGVILVAAHDGSHAVARYHRQGMPNGEGLRRRHEFESWPDTPHAERFRYDDAKDGETNGMGIFRLSSAPEHMDDVAALYDARIKQHREESTASA